MTLKSPNPKLDIGDVHFFEEYGVLATIALAVAMFSVSLQ